MGNQLTFKLGPFQDQVNRRLDLWETQDFARRIWAKDPAIWHPEPLPEITDRLGWISLPERMQEKCKDILSFAHQIKNEGFSHVLLLGMGGSSLAPEILQKTFGNAPGYPELFVLDSTHPDAILAMENKLNLTDSLILVSSKSGSTLETLSLFRYFWNRVSEKHNNPGRCFVAITDADSPLERLATEKKFRRTFLSSSDVGGRYSAFTEFGLVPAALIGIDIEKLLEKGRLAAEESNSPRAEKKSPAFILGAALGELTLHKDKLTIWTTPALDSVPLWLEQLLAESTGKQGKGIIPVVDEAIIPAELYGQDRVFIGLFLEKEIPSDLEQRLNELEVYNHPTLRITLEDKLDLGREFFQWEMATASAGAILGIHPFNQPDVQLAKDLTSSVMEKGIGAESAAIDPLDRVSTRDEDKKACATAISRLLSEVLPGGYISLQAYLPPSPEIMQALQGVRTAILKRSHLATTLGFGPRFLHSAGQLHKGGPASVLAIQLTDDPKKDFLVPETGYTFATLINAQAIGDFHALRRKKRQVLRISLGKRPVDGLKKLERYFSDGG
jgi:transaldolase/glucose-6-phosphate isomerase